MNDIWDQYDISPNWVANNEKEHEFVIEKLEMHERVR